MKTNNQIKYWAVLFTAMAFAACTQDDEIAPSPAVSDVDNALTQLPGNTPVRIITLMDGEEVDSRVGANETFAVNEIHEQGKMVAKLYIVDSEATNSSWGNNFSGSNSTTNADFTAKDEQNSDSEYVLFDGITQMTNSSGEAIKLADFQNNNEMTILWGDNEKSVFSLSDSICGWSQLAIHATSAEPVLVYHMQRTRAKVTLKLTDAETDEEMCLYKGVYAVVYTEQTLSSVIKNGNDYELAIYNNPHKATYYFPGCFLTLPYDATGNELSVANNHNDGEGLYELTGLVYASATHRFKWIDSYNGSYEKITNLSTETVNIDEGRYDSPYLYPGYSLVSGDPNDNKAYLYVEIEHGHDDTTMYPNYPHLGTHGGGVYRINLEDITMSDGNKLKRLEAGKHYIITLSLKHNKLVGATATIGGWDEYTGTTAPTDDSKVSNP